jgi:hypothetical protein
MPHAPILGVLDPLVGFGPAGDTVPESGSGGLVTHGLVGGGPVVRGLTSAGAPGPPPPLPPAPEEDIFRDIAARLEATGAFAQVILNSAPERGAERWPRALVQDPLSPTETYSGTGLVWRRVEFWVTIAHRETEANRRYGGLKWLERVARAALDGVSLAGITLPAWTRILRADTPPNRARGRWTAPRPLEPELRLVGQCAYEIDERRRSAGAEPD